MKYAGWLMDLEQKNLAIKKKEGERTMDAF
jgi:hypothetical protein